MVNSIVHDAKVIADILTCTNWYRKKENNFSAASIAHLVAHKSAKSKVVDSRPIYSDSQKHESRCLLSDHFCYISPEISDFGDYYYNS